MKKVSTLNLPKLCCGATPSRMSTDIHILHWKALALTKKSHDVEVAEIASDVIPIINWFFEILKAGLVEAAGCTPVCGESAEDFHSTQSLAVRVPVWVSVVDGCLFQECLASKMGQIL